MQILHSGTLEQEVLLRRWLCCIFLGYNDIGENAAREKGTRVRLTLDDGVVGDVQRLQYRTVFSQCVDIRPTTKIVEGQGEGLYMNKPSEG